MPQLFGRLRGRPALAWLRHRRWWMYYVSGTDNSTEILTEDGVDILAEDGDPLMTEGR